MTTNLVDGISGTSNNNNINSDITTPHTQDPEQDTSCASDRLDASSDCTGQQLDVFMKHVNRQQQLEAKQRQRDRRSSLPVDAIELSTLSGVVMRRKQQLQLRYHQQQQQQQQPKVQQNHQQPQQASNSSSHKQQFLVPTNPSSNTNNKGRPLSISSISSAASSGSSSSANSSASSGIQSSLTRNGSLNYGHEYRKQAYLASIESLNSPQSSSGKKDACLVNESQTIEAALRNLNLNPSGQFRDAAARAAVLAAGAQSRNFGQSPTSNKVSGISRSFHASLRYDKQTAYRIHLMANARALRNAGTEAGQQQDHVGCDDQDQPQQQQQLRRIGSISRNNSSTSSDSSGHHRQSISLRNPRFMCQCGSNPSLTSSSSASQVNQATNGEKDEDASRGDGDGGIKRIKAATLDGASCQRSAASTISGSAASVQHHPDCFYSRVRPRRASSKLQPSPSSASSHSNTSSLFRDDGFEDDLTSTGSEHLSGSSYHPHHRLSFQGRSQYHSHRQSQHSSSRNGEDDDDYQSCEEEFSNSHTTASTTSNLDDCALSTTSSSLMQHDQQILNKISLANAKQEYRRSLLIEHQQQQHLLQAQHVAGQSKIQSLLQTTSPQIFGHPGSPVSIQSANTSATSSNISSTATNSPTKQTKCDDRTVNIIGHMPTRSPGYWDSNLSITQRVVTEIIETERAYVDDLEQIVTGYICYLRNVLKQQQKSHSCTSKRSSIDTTTPMVTSEDGNPTLALNNDEDDKSMLVFDDDTTTNELEDYDEEPENEIAAAKENNSAKQNPTKQHLNVPCNGAIMTSHDIKKLFSNLEDIYKFNKDLLFRLEECYLNPSSVAECFVENASGFEVYTHYCTMYPQVVSTLTELMGNPTSAQLLKERQNELSQSLPLGAYLLKPVQRILKYHILFQSLIKHTADDTSVDEKDLQLINEAFSVMTNIACHINAMKKRHEHAIRVQEVQGLLSGWNGPDLTTLGELFLEDSFKLYNRPKSSRHLFLFDNVLLITKKKRDGSLCYKGHIACSNLMLIENIDGQPLVFNTVPFDNPKALCAFQARNLDKKRDWCVQMKDLIIKSFEVKIPVHVRDILMSLTNSSSATKESSPKSSSSESARVLRAPNYLEKKKRAKLEKKR